MIQCAGVSPGQDFLLLHFQDLSNLFVLAVPKVCPFSMPASNCTASQRSIMAPFCSERLSRAQPFFPVEQSNSTSLAYKLKSCTCSLLLAWDVTECTVTDGVQFSRAPLTLSVPWKLNCSDRPCAREFSGKKKKDENLKNTAGDQAFHLKYSYFKSDYKVVGCIVCNHGLCK